MSCSCTTNILTVTTRAPGRPDYLCRARYNAFRCDFLHVVDEIPTNKSEACLFPFFVREILPMQWFQKLQNDHKLSEKNKTKKCRLPIVCSCGSNNTRSKNQIENHKLKWGMANTYVTILVMYLLFYMESFIGKAS